MHISSKTIEDETYNATPMSSAFNSFSSYSHYRFPGGATIAGRGHRRESSRLLFSWEVSFDITNGLLNGGNFFSFFVRNFSFKFLF